MPSDKGLFIFSHKIDPKLERWEFIHRLVRQRRISQTCPPLEDYADKKNNIMKSIIVPSLAIIFVFFAPFVVLNPFFFYYETREIYEKAGVQGLCPDLKRRKILNRFYKNGLTSIRVFIVE
jgi:hypothetical protein